MIADLSRRRLPIPPPYDDPPQYDPLLFGPFIRAFNELSRERRPSERQGKGFTVYRIAYRDMREWCERNGYAGDSDFMDEIFAYIPALDAVWVELETKRIKAKQPNGEP